MSLTGRSRASVCPVASDKKSVSVVKPVTPAGSAKGGAGAVVARRDLGLLGLAAVVASPLVAPSNAAAVGFKKELKKRKIPEEDYVLQEASGLRIYELEEGRGRAVALGDTVSVHFDCLYRGIDAVSSRYARTLGGNRTIAEPLEFVAGEAVSGSLVKPVGESGGGGLFSGTPGPKPPQAVSRAVVGMKPGGRRSVIVDQAELGYPKGEQEIPPGAKFELRIELLSVAAGAAPAT